MHVPVKHHFLKISKLIHVLYFKLCCILFFYKIIYVFSFIDTL